MSEGRECHYCDCNSCQKKAKARVLFTIGELKLDHDLCEDCFIEFMRKCQSPELKVTTIISLEELCLSRVLHNVITNTMYDKILKKEGNKRS